MPRNQAPGRARLAGFFYLLVFITGAAAVPASRLIVANDAAATATNILAHQPAFLAGYIAYLLNIACYIVVTMLFNELFAPVDVRLSHLAVLMSVVGCAVQASACLFQIGVLTVLRGEPYLTPGTPAQLQAIAMLLLELFALGYNVGLVFFGFYCLLIGVLAFRSAFLPRAIGVLMACAGVGWLTFLSPPLAHQLEPYVRIPGVLGELSITLWLLVRGARDAPQGKPTT